MTSRLGTGISGTFFCGVGVRKRRPNDHYLAVLADREDCVRVELGSCMSRVHVQWQRVRRGFFGRGYLGCGGRRGLTQGLARNSLVWQACVRFPAPQLPPGRRFFFIPRHRGTKDCFITEKIYVNKYLATPVSATLY